MGFFSKLFVAEPVQYKINSETEACAAILIACMQSDESSSEEENTALYITLKSRTLFAGMDVLAMIERGFTYLRKVGSPSGLVDAAVGAIQPQNRMPLFLHCMDIILADGVVSKDESEILDYLKEKFGINDDFAKTAAEIMMMKNRL